jgi:hypothetical protein
VSADERGGGPGPRPEADDAERIPRDVPHVTLSDRGAELQDSTPAPDDVAASPANAHGSDTIGSEGQIDRVDDTSMYDRRPGEDKDRDETDMP